MGQEASGEETAVAADADVGENSSGGQEGMSENPSDQSSSGKDRADSSNQGNESKTDSAETKNNDPISWKDFFYYCGIYILINVGYIIGRFLFKLLMDIVNFTRRLRNIDDNNPDINELRELANECIKLRIIDLGDSSENTLPISIDAVDQVLNNYQDNKKTNWFKDLINTYNPANWAFFKKKMHVPVSDIYLLLITDDEYSKEDFRNQIKVHKEAIWDIYCKRSPRYIWKITWNFFLWNIPVQAIVICVFAVLRFCGGLF